LGGARDRRDHPGALLPAGDLRELLLPLWMGGMRTLLGLSGFFVAIPLLIAWAKVRYWDWLNARNAR